MDETFDESLDSNNQDNSDQKPENIHHEIQVNKISGMYKEWFLDYASYVILERAIPDVFDGFKPVQRRIMHSMRELDDGRYNKVANLVGNTMKYHPHGDASIGDAMVQIGQKDILIDTQGNWGNVLTGDRAAAPRYIEARLSKFALDVVFNPKTTIWQSSYDGRNQEPVHLPVKFPMLLAQGVEGIAVGLSTKIMPHNFNELIDASVNYLQDKKFNILPDFITGGIADFSNYNDGERGGKIRVRSRILIEDKRTLKITEIPFGTTTSSLIDSIIKANDKGKIKIKKIEDNTAENVEILIYLPPNISPDKTIDALYAFTDCELSISPLCCVIVDGKPEFVSVSEILRKSTDNTVRLLKKELEIQLNELNEQWHMSSLERIFIENRIYRDIENQETWEGVIATIHKGLKPHIKHLIREVTDDDVVKLTEIKIKRISKFDLDKAQQYIDSLENRIAEVKYKLSNLIEYSIEYFKNLKKKYGQGRERKTEIRLFEDIEATKVVIKNEKLFVNRADGFVGTSLKKDEFVSECSDIDDVIVFRADGKMVVSKVSTKAFFGKNIIHVAVFKKGDKRTVYNLVYVDGVSGISYMKRFNVTSITRDKEYDLTSGSKGSKILYFTANPNGEAEIISINLKNLQKVKKLKFDVDFSELAIKGRGVKGNQVSKLPIKKIELKEKGQSTLAARKIWFDDAVRRLNVDGRGELIGEFSGDDKLMIITSKGSIKLVNPELNTHFDDEMIVLEKWNPNKPISAVYYEANKERYYLKRFIFDKFDKEDVFISETKGSELITVSTEYRPMLELEFVKERGKDRKDNEIVNVEEFVSIKGFKALGNQLSKDKIRNIKELEALEYIEPKVVEEKLEEDENQTSIEFDK
jgi:topoisomerase-4 subunit A